jgi:hypothetical protein
MLITICIGFIIAQDTPGKDTGNESTSKKEQFELGLRMIDGYRADLQDRLEKSTALLIIVIGWLITSDTARKSISNNPLLFWGAIGILTALMAMYCLTISNFIDHFIKIQNNIDVLGYMDSLYLVRYKMPNSLYSVPVSFSYIAPVAALYFFIVLILVQIKYGFIFPSKTANREAE